MFVAQQTRLIGAPEASAAGDVRVDDCHTGHRPLTHRRARAIVAALTRLRDSIARLRAQRRARAQLLALDDRGLAEIGISRAQAQFEAEKPFWKV
jgi:uncharacterized protein YjiS (DUF1127 family)